MLAAAELVAESILTDSEEPFARRTYSYDFDLDATGTAHVIYSRPVPGEQRTEITYATGRHGGWRQDVLDGDGKLGSISTHILLDRASGVLHVCYIQHQDDPHTRLVYRTITNGVVSAPQEVSPGGWHTRMQLTADGKPIFVRESERGLHLVAAEGDGWQDVPLNLPPAVNYRLADFRFDSASGRYHVTYGDDTTLSNLLYATSTDGQTWSISIVDDTRTLYELEFWTALALDLEGDPHAMLYRFKPKNDGTTAALGSLTDNGWNTRIIAGGQPHSRAGGGLGLAFDEQDGFHGVMDNSPDVPIDSEGSHGTILHYFSPDGERWIKETLRLYSAEGKCRVRVLGNRLFLLVLGDYTDAKLFFVTFDLPPPSRNLLEIATDAMFYFPGDTLRLMARTQGRGTADWYLHMVTPHGNRFFLGDDGLWHQVRRRGFKRKLKPLRPSADLPVAITDLAAFPAAGTSPFSEPGEFMLYSVAVQPGGRFKKKNFLTPTYTNRVHIW